MRISTERLERWAYIATVVGFPLLILSTLAVLYQIGEVKTIAASQNNIALSSQLFNNTNTGIISDIENGKPILVENGGHYTDAQLDNYIGDFDTIDDAYSAGFLSANEMCDSFSYFISTTWNDTEVQKYLSANGAYFQGLPDLEHDVASSTNSTCH